MAKEFREEVIIKTTLKQKDPRLTAAQEVSERLNNMEAIWSAKFARMEELLCSLANTKTAPEASSPHVPTASKPLTETTLNTTENKADSGVYYNCNESPKTFSNVPLPNTIITPLMTDLINPFDPNDKNTNIEKYIDQIENVSILYGWSEEQCILIMHSGLRGLAEKWLIENKHSQLSWTEWRNVMRLNFPVPNNYAEMLLDLIKRKKMNTENMSKYFHDKAELCQRVDIKGANAVSMIIDGLPEKLQLEAVVYNFQTTSALRDFLKNHWTTFKAITSTPEATKRKKVKCYNCLRIGDHYAKDCLGPKMDKCRMCGKVGHSFLECRKLKIVKQE